MSDNDEESDGEDSDDQDKSLLDQLKEIRTVLVIKLAAQLVEMWK